MGGDELNVLKKGANYGWPIVTHGLDDDGSVISNETSRAGMQDPAAFWTPSISPAAIEFYTGKQFPRWQNHLLLGSLTSLELRRLEIQGDRVVKQEVLIKNFGRIRDLGGWRGETLARMRSANGRLRSSTGSSRKMASVALAAAHASGLPV